MRFSYGIMQGRLSEKIGNKIQAFPQRNWKSEFYKAKKLGLSTIEWTLDYKNLKNNPIFFKSGQSKIKKLSKKNSIKVKSLTGDCFMQKPFWKFKNNKRLVNDLKDIIYCSKKVGIEFIVVPLVDNGSITNFTQKKNLIKICNEIKSDLKKTGTKLIFESDFPPLKLKKFIMELDTKYFGINYDTGNSAALNYNMDLEFKSYGKYIYNIHIKDRIKNGNTIRLGNGNTNFNKLYKNLRKLKYKRNLILQTARSKNNQHMNEIKINLAFLNTFHNEKK